MLENIKTRISRQITKLRDAKVADLLLLQTRREAEVAKHVPAGISDMPPKKTQDTLKSSAQFPVNTVFKARNSAFVGRDDLLEDIANTFGTLQQTGTPKGSNRASSPSDANQSDRAGTPASSTPDHRSAVAANSPTICVLHGLGGVGKTQVALEFYYQYRRYYDGCFWMEAEKSWTLDSSFCKIADSLGLLPKKTTDDGGHELAGQAVEAGRNWLQTTGKASMA